MYSNWTLDYNTTKMIFSGKRYGKKYSRCLKAVKMLRWKTKSLKLAKAFHIKCIISAIDG